MAEFDHSGGTATLDQKHDSAGINIDAGKSDANHSNESHGSSIHAEDTSKSLDQIKPSTGNKNGDSTDHNHAPSDNPLPKMSDNYAQHNGTQGSDKITGGKGDDFIFPGKDTFKFNTAEAKSGAEEFPFPNPSKGSSQANASLDDKGNFKVDGSFKNFEAAPLFSQGEKQIDPKATILNGSDPQALIDGFLKVPEDVEKNKISGTHLHFSPTGDDRGPFADATVVRYFDNKTNSDGKSGTISGDFKLKPEEQAALLAGNLYANIHSNVDVDKDGKAGFPTGENRLNFNQKVVQFT